MTRTDSYHRHSTMDVPYKFKRVINKYSVYLISLPPNVCQPKFTSKYKIPDYANDIDVGIFYYVVSGN